MTPKPTKSFLALAFISILSLFPNPVKVVFSLTDEIDYSSLLAFKSQITSDPSEALTSWNSSTHFCAWNGVTCGKKHRRVTELTLHSLGLAGTLSPQVANLTFLRVLNLGGNDLSGTLPQEISQLSRLQVLNAVNNSLEGELPKNLTNCPDLRIISLGGNDHLHGIIPDELGSLHKLTYLGLSANSFTGTIPPSLGNLSALTALFLRSNYLQGSIPPELGQLFNLNYLQLSGNALTGHIPTSLYNISTLTYFSMIFNNLTGSLPPDLFQKLPNLQGFYLSANEFSGPFPATMANASALVEINIAVNAFTGPIPSSLGSLKSLQFLNLGDNFLGAEDGDDFRILTTLTNCTNLRILILNHNVLRGVLPSSIGNLSASLTYLWLDRNLISSNIPSQIGNLVNLESLALYGNQLVGSIPDSIGKLSNLQDFIIAENNLTGRIPSSLGNMTSLSGFNIEKNAIEGPIPASIGNCTNLNEVLMSQNELAGPVPLELLSLSSLSKALELARNRLTGPIPSQVGKLVNLIVLDLSENRLSGELPPTLGDCLLLQSVKLEGNRFSGSIPASLVSVRGIEVLDLSRNNFSGHIPGFLSDLRFISNLNLSFNMFEGEVPIGGAFGNLSAVSVVGNDGLCGGIPTLQLPKCKGGQRNRSHRRTVVAICVSVSIFSILAAIAVVVIYRSGRLKKEAASDSSVEDHHPKLSYGELSRATDRFSLANIIGEGSFGVVYKGVLPSNGQTVAIKVLKLQERGAGKSFLAECEALRTIRHRNLVKNITSCSGIDFKGEDFKALVFEFMPNGSLEKWLHPAPDERGVNNNTTTLSVAQRLNIAIDVAAALDYLHHQGETPIVHCDLKPSNVLLDSDSLAHLSDFGLAKFLMARASAAQISSIGIRGTIGYVAPEYGVGGAVSTQADVYSFGILLLELFTGKRPTEPSFGDNFSLREFVEGSLPHGLHQVLDPVLGLGGVQDNRAEFLVSVLHTGLMCSVEQPKERIDISEAATALRKAQAALRVGTRRNRV